MEQIHILNRRNERQKTRRKQSAMNSSAHPLKLFQIPASFCTPRPPFRVFKLVQSTACCCSNQKKEEEAHASDADEPPGGHISLHHFVVCGVPDHRRALHPVLALARHRSN